MLTRFCRLIALPALLVFGGVAAAQAQGVPGIDKNKCLGGKTKCVTKKVKGLLKCREKCQKNPAKCGAVQTACETKVMDKFDGGANPAKGCFAKLEAKENPAKPDSICTTTGDTVTVETQVDGMVAEIVATLEGSPPPLTCSMPGAVLGGFLAGATLTGCDLSGANLHGAILCPNANLSGANLSGADFNFGTCFGGSNLSGADLSNTDLSANDVSGADLSGADLSGTNMGLLDAFGTDLTGATTSAATNVLGLLVGGGTCPDGAPPMSGSSCRCSQWLGGPPIGCVP